MHVQCVRAEYHSLGSLGKSHHLSLYPSFIQYQPFSPDHSHFASTGLGCEGTTWWLCSYIIILYSECKCVAGAVLAIKFWQNTELYSKKIQKIETTFESVLILKSHDYFQTSILIGLPAFRTC